MLGHPKGLFILALTEMWERFSYYGMRALLIFYLTKHFLFSDVEAGMIYGSYVAMIYLLPVIGGALADRYIGASRAVTSGALFLVVGHLGMAIEGPAATLSGSNVERSEFHVQVLFLSLASIAVGVGFLKGNISIMVGKLYGDQDGRRDGGFTIYYIGINVGAAIAAAACGYLGQAWGWSWGFGLAGVGMCLGLGIFLWGQRFLQGIAEPRDPARLKAGVWAGISREHLVYLFGVFLVLVVWLLLQRQQLIGGLLGGTSTMLAAFLVWYGARHCSSAERYRLLTIVVLVVFSTVFWALMEQSGSSLGLLIDRAVDRQLWGFSIPASMFQSLPAVFVVLLGSAFVALWRWLAVREIEPDPALKFVIGMVLAGLSFLMLAQVLDEAQGQELIPLYWIIILYFLQTSGELCVSPVGLSMVSRVSPAGIAGMMMGIWFLASAAAGFAGGVIAGMATVPKVAGEALDISVARDIYSSLYADIGLITLGAALLLLLLAPRLRFWMKN